MKVKKFLSLLLSLVMAISMVSNSAFAEVADAEGSNGIYDIISKGIASSAGYLQKSLDDLHEDGGVTYGFEWYIISLLRGGKEIDEAILAEYYESVKETASTWTSETKPTDISRVALTLTLMDKDIADVNGVNLSQLIYNSTKLTDGSNELSYALLALDALGTQIPDTAEWDREEMISELLTFQTIDGSFGLYDNLTGDVDATAICVQALAPYQQNEEVAVSLENALRFLKDAVSQEYNYSDNSNTTAQVLIALATLNIDITDPSEGFGDENSNIITALEAYKNPEDNGYLYGENVNPMATVQVLQAYDAYRKAHKDGVSYWDFMAAGEIYDDVITDEDTKTDDDTQNSGEAARAALIYVTIASDGAIVEDKDGGYVAQAPVTVADIDEDGTLTVDEALYAAHEAYYEGGAEAGYASSVSAYGLSLATLWGNGSPEAPASAGYWLNNVSCWSMEDEVNDGDYLTAFNYYDAVGWSDAFSYFTQNEETAKSGNSVTLELCYLSGYDAENGYSPMFSPCSDANVVFLGSNNSLQKNLKTDADGKVKIKFPSSANAGGYYVMAYKEDNSIVPTVCKITVTKSSSDGGGASTTNITAYIRVADPKGKTYLAKKAYSVEKGTTVYELLKRTGLDIETTRNAYGTYVNSVEGLAEFDEGPQSGWMFRVNGKFPEYSISSHVLSNRDYVELLYTRNMGEDIGDTYVKNSSGGSAAVSYSVKFDSKEGSYVTNQKINKNGYVTKPSDPEKDGYVFGGWYTDEKLNTPYDFASKVTKDFTLYAKWTKPEEEIKEEENLQFDENTFPDVKTDAWYYDAVKFVYENNLIQGTDYGFEPEEKMTRAMLVTVLWRMEEEPVVNYLMMFDDVDEAQWYTEAVRWAASEKITSGTDDSTFGINDKITREQMITMLYRFALKKQDSSVDSQSLVALDVYSDAKVISGYAHEAMNWAVDAGILNGKSENKLCPADDLSRGEVATILMRFCKGFVQ